MNINRMVNLYELVITRESAMNCGRGAAQHPSLQVQHLHITALPPAHIAVQASKDNLRECLLFL